MFFIQQANHHDCGFTTLKILLANLHHDRNYLFLASPFKDDENVSIYSLIQEGKKYDTTLLALRAENKYELSSNVDVPFIAVLASNYSPHAVYVFRVSKKYVYYFDPVSGKKKNKINDFVSLWTGELLTIKDYAPYRCPIKRSSVISIKERMITCLLEVLSAVSAVLAVYFINKDSYIYLPLIFFTLMIVLEMILKRYSLSIMNHIDKRMNESLGEIKNNDFYAFYYHFEHYKKYLLVNNLSIFSNAFAVMLIVLVLLLNDKMNALYAFLNIFLAAISIFFFHPLLDKEEVLINEKEEKLKVVNTKEEAVSLMNETRSKSYSYASKVTMYKYVIIFIQVIASFIMMMFLKVVNVTYIICYTFLQIYLYNNLEELLLKPHEKEKQDNLLNKIIDMNSQHK